MAPLQLAWRRSRCRECRQVVIVINGESHEIPDGLTVAALLERVGMRSDRVAIERNRDILPRARWAETQVQASDSFEIVQLVGGG